MTPLQHYIAPVVRRWPLVLVVAVLGGLITGAWWMTSATTTWTATTALSTQSQKRSPEQDAVLALGYVDFFNQSTYQQLLREKVPTIPEGVELVARTGASSPILYIDALAASERDARNAASAAADGFREDVRQSLLDERAREVADLQAQVDSNVQVLQQLGTTEAEDGVILDQIRSLQGRITDISSDATNHLKQLQPVPGVSGSTPSPVVDIVAGVLGGGVLGVALALLLATMDVRIRSLADVHRLGLETLADLTDRDLRGRRIGNLVNSLSMAGPGRPVVVAVVSPHDGATGSAFAREIAAAACSRRAGALLVRADLRRTASDGVGRPGLVDVLSHQVAIRSLVVIEPDGLPVLPPGGLAGQDPNIVIEPDRLVEFVGEAGTNAGFVVLDASPICDAPESQVVCAVADHVIIVVERSVTLQADVREAVQRLAEVHAQVTGVIIDVRSAVVGAPVDDQSPLPGQPEGIGPARLREDAMAGAGRNGFKAGMGGSGGPTGLSTSQVGDARRNGGINGAARLAPPIDPDRPTPYRRGGSDPIDVAPTSDSAPTDAPTAASSSGEARAVEPSSAGVAESALSEPLPSNPPHDALASTGDQPAVPGPVEAEGPTRAGGRAATDSGSTGAENVVVESDVATQGG